MKRPIPVPSAHDAPFWDAAKDGKLLIQQTASGSWQSYPRAHAVGLIETTAPEYRIASGRGTIETLSVVHRSFYSDIPAPYVFAIVRLEEGPSLAANIVGEGSEAAKIGDAVTVRFEEVAPDRCIPVFELGSGEEAP